MGRVTIYVSQSSEERFQEKVEKAEKAGLTLIEYLMAQAERADELESKFKSQQVEKMKEFEAYTLYLGMDSEKEWLSFRGKLLYQSEINENIISIYEGIQGKYMTFYALSEDEAKYEIHDTLEKSTEAILKVPYEMLEEGHEFEETEFHDLLAQYDESAKEACKKLRITSVGDDVERIIF